MLVRDLQTRLSQAALREDWPKWSDLSKGRVAVDEATIQAIREKLQRYRHCVVTGHEARGKTTTLRTFGYLEVCPERRVYHLDCSEPGGDSVERICEFIREFNGPLYLVENVHEIYPEQGWKQILEATLATQMSQFLYTERASGAESVLEDLAYQLDVDEPRQLKVHLDPTQDQVRLIIETYIRTHPDRALEKPQPPEYQDILRTCGGNLAVLAAYLDAWDAGPFHEISEDRMLSNVYRRRLLLLPSDLRTTYVNVSAVAQYGVAVLGDVFGLVQGQELARRRLLNRNSRDGSIYFSLPHPSECRINVWAWARRTSIDREVFTADALRRYLSSDALRWQDYVLIRRLREQPTIQGAVLSDQAVWTRLMGRIAQDLDSMSLTEVVQAFEISSVDRNLLDRVRHIVSGRPQLWEDKFAATNIDIDKAGSAIRRMRHLAPALWEDVSRCLTQADWRQIWLRTRLPDLIGFLGRYAKEPEVHDHVDLAREVLQELVRSPDLAERLGSLRYVYVGRLLFVVRSLQPTLLQSLGEQVADVLKLRPCLEPGRLTLILKEIWDSNSRVAHAKLLLRVLDEVPLDVFAAEESGRALAYLLLNVKLIPTEQLPQERKRHVLKQVLSFAVPVRIEFWTPRSLSTLLWNAAVLDEAQAREWAKGIPEHVLVHSLDKTADVGEAFFLLWNLFLVNHIGAQNMAQEQGAKLKERFWISEVRSDVPSLALVGLLSSFCVHALGAVRLPPSRDTVRRLAGNAPAIMLLFTLRAYKRLTTGDLAVLVAALRAELQRRAQDFTSAVNAQPTECGRSEALAILRECGIAPDAE